MMECFEPAANAEQMLARLEVIGRHATSALYNAAEHRRIPMRFIWLPLAAILVGEHTDVLVTYDEHGGYDHPDHIQVHRVGMEAARRAQVPVVYMATMNRDFFRTLGTLADYVEASLNELV